MLELDSMRKSLGIYKEAQKELLIEIVKEKDPVAEVEPLLSYSSKKKPKTDFDDLLLDFTNNDDYQRFIDKAAKIFVKPRLYLNENIWLEASSKY